MGWMIYGATGYTGGLIAREAKQRRLRPARATGGLSAGARRGTLDRVDPD